ncbi:MAG: hypothetical protein GY941_02145, partial [Planctomycetes bacterium]|nr:hypothetical protein [Planctomycetota bacterium]
MNIIGIETSGIFGSVCVRDENIVAGERTFGRKPGPGNEIVSSLYSIFQETALAPDDINLIAVSIGPGSYTG